MIAQRRRSNWQLELRFLGEKVNGFLGDFRIKRSFLFEARQKLEHRPRIKQRAGKAVLSNFACLLEDVNIFFAELRVRMLRVMRIDKLREAQRASHPGRPATDNNHIGRHLRA